MNCPRCDAKMNRAELGIKFDGTHALGWRCTGGKGVRRCYNTIYDGERPWAIEMPRWMWMRFIRDHGHGPGEWMTPPIEWLKTLAPGYRPPAKPKRKKKVDKRQLVLC